MGDAQFLQPHVLLVLDDGPIAQLLQFLDDVGAGYQFLPGQVDVEGGLVAVFVDSHGVVGEGSGVHSLLHVEVVGEGLDLVEGLLVPVDPQVADQHVHVLDQGGVFDDADQHVGVDGVIALLDVEGEVDERRRALLPPPLRELIVLL